MSGQSRVLFAAHDPGGARFLSPVIPMVLARGLEVMLAATGPAADIWRSLGDVTGDTKTALAEFAPHLVVTGTGFGDFERAIWLAVRNRAVPSVAVIDAWTNLRRRFSGESGVEVLPDALCVPDQIMADEIAAGGWCTSRVHVTGHPHLQETVQRLKNQRIGHLRSEPPIVAFFSEPVIQDHGGASVVGYDQFGVMDAVVGALGSLGAARLIVQPHPREHRENWARWLEDKPEDAKRRISIGEWRTDELLNRCDAVVGMTSMVLAEAALSGIASLSLQPGRKAEINPLMGRIAQIDIVSDPHGIAVALGRLVGGGVQPIQSDQGMDAILCDARRRLMGAIETELAFS
ncbi:MAG: hypothetical protein HN403_04500 [Rhodospirillales bacterium]|jgi:hypothetical protein|nr:hypothetical protein [Rhodospirillales bacterium]